MSEPRKNHLNIDGAQQKEEEHADSYKPIPEAEQEFLAKSNLGKSKEKVSSDPAEEKLLKKEDEVKIAPMSTEAKYDHRNGDTKIELDAAKKTFSGLTKEELLKYADDPFWVRLRWFMFLLFWALWLGMLVGAIAIIVRAPKCAPPPPKTWYELGPLVDLSSEEAINYEDLEAQLPLFESAKVQGVFINPCEDTYQVLDDQSCVDKFKKFLEKAKDKGVKFIVDLTANFVSTSHAWFLASENRTEEFSEYFVWGVDKDHNEANRPYEPNNWISRYDEKAWTWSDTREEYYLHQYRVQQADLNFHNQAVVKRFDDVLKTWIKAGAAGVRLLKARQLVVDGQLRNDAVNPAGGAASLNQWAFLNHNSTSDQPELGNLFAHWSHLVTNTGDNVFTIHEDGSLRPEWYKYRNASMLHPPSSAPLSLSNNVTEFVEKLKKVTNVWTALQLTAEDPANNEELAALAMLLPATPVLLASQLPEYNNDTYSSEKFSHLAALRDEASIKYGEQHIATVTDNSSAVLVAVARWKSGQPGYVCVLNPSAAPARAALGPLPHMAPALSVHHVTAVVRLHSNYTTNAPVSAEDVIVPGNSAVVLSYVPKMETTE